MGNCSKKKNYQKKTYVFSHNSFLFIASTNKLLKQSVILRSWMNSLTMTLVALATAGRVDSPSNQATSFQFHTVATSKAPAQLHNPLIRHSVWFHVQHHTSIHSLHHPFNSAIHLSTVPFHSHPHTVDALSDP